MNRTKNNDAVLPLYCGAEIMKKSYIITKQIHENHIRVHDKYKQNLTKNLRNRSTLTICG